MPPAKNCCHLLPAAACGCLLPCYLCCRADQQKGGSGAVEETNVLLLVTDKRIVIRCGYTGEWGGLDGYSP